MSIGTNIKKYRKFRGLTQSALANRINISRSYLADLESDRYNPSLGVLKSISEGLNIKVNDLLKEEDKDTFCYINEVPGFDNTTTGKKATHKKTEHSEFNTPQEAIKFILEQPSIMGFGGFDVNKMTDEEIMDFANELLGQLKLLSYKYKK